MTLKRIDEELQKKVDGIMALETIRFCDLRRDELQAVALDSPFIGPDGFFYWEELHIFNNPFVLAEETYTPLNPARSSRFKTSKILTRDLIVVRRNEEHKSLGIWADICGRKGPKYNTYDFKRQQKPEGVQRVVFDESRVIPIYTDNEDFLFIMAHIEGKGEGR